MLKITTRLGNSITRRTYIRPHYYSQEPLSKAIQRKRLPLNDLDPNKVLWTLIGTNATVFLGWQYAIQSYKQFGDPAWLEWMSRHFVSSEDAVNHGRYHTLLTSVFSHQDLTHLGVNMLVLHSMGQGVMQAIGVSRFLGLYTGAGLVASMVGIGYRKYIRPRLENKRGSYSRALHGSMGASGAVMGITTFFACAFPKATFLVFFIVPMPAIAVVGLFAAYDVYQSYAIKRGSLVDSAAHLGGAAYGAAYWFTRVRPMLRAGRWHI
ncbi:uncharacterized protein B0P05DRAFT_533248 [Gilbertella persicaria]|uniref:Peptidase S54 rhomboid domain-containing protein n=1 Tax=Rhizopus stolonifer TaxID=4846 RepID=A0A367KV05_RHIST|nr:uncharacterized protein B0P05DRAFT_533248 [Gilbertella persicaria]KAI8086996.1 hypothetical protein B0P05DRAFT_533248 [Gilbertella persicaria]RCI05994.1 hypothetical protein CU098_012092 [Rhizopus stolonifer]